MLPRFQLDAGSAVPLYRQVYDHIRLAILSGALERGERLPATRELAGQLGLNRQTISTAYELLESDSLVSGQVGRGSFVTGAPLDPPENASASSGGLNWEGLLNADQAPSAPVLGDVPYSFAASRPSELQFPLAEFRASAQEVISGANAASILQLGSPHGYPALRRYLLEEARREGVARDTDDILITNGCQQALDLLHRTLCSGSETCLVEDPVYPGLRSVLTACRSRAVGMPMTETGLDIEVLTRLVNRERPKALFVTPSFQNPTGTTIPVAARKALLDSCRATGTVVVEIDIYSELRYSGESLPALKRLDSRGDVVLIRSFSKLAFPGLRVGWVVAPKPLIRFLAASKRSTDLHTDQLSQAIVLAFAESGKLAAHRDRVIASGAQRLRVALETLGEVLPAGSSFTRPEGGMSIWVRLPEMFDTSDLLERAQQAGVSFLPGRYFGAGRDHNSSLRISFTGLDVEQIRKGLRILGAVLEAEGQRLRAAHDRDPQPALV